MLGWIVDLGGAVLLLLLGSASYLAGLFMNVLFVALLCAVPITLLSFGLGVWRRDLIRIGKYGPAHLLQLLIRCAFWIIAPYTILFCVIPVQLGDQMRFVSALVVCSAAAVFFLQWLPRRRIFWGMNVLLAMGAVFMAVQLWRIQYPPLADALELRPPFTGDWLVFQGGASGLVNHHYAVSSQRDAIDFVRIVDGHMTRPSADARVQDSTYAWGEPILAPADGTVVEIESDLPDNPIGKTDAHHAAGNHVIIDVGGGRYVMLAHLQHGSVRVAKGDRVQTGQELAKCGNSGNTSGPHLHVQVQTTPTFGTRESRTIPILWRGGTRLRGSQRTTEPAAVRRNDVLSAGALPAQDGSETVPR